MTKKKTSLAEYGGLADLAAARQGRGAQADPTRAALEAASLPVFKGQIPRAVAFQRAALLGRLVSETGDPRAAECAAAYQAIGDELVAMIEGRP
jgi:cellulose biosynthesis protein BcsQ